VSKYLVRLRAADAKLRLSLLFFLWESLPVQFLDFLWAVKKVMFHHPLVDSTLLSVNTP